MTAPATRRPDSRWHAWLHGRRDRWLPGATMLVAALATPWYVQESLAVAISLFWLLMLGLTWRHSEPTAAEATEPTVVTEAVEPLPAAMQEELLALRGLRDELVAARQTAEAATLAKDEFLATMSHEIRTPLNGIVPLLELLLSTPLAADQRDYLATAQQSAHELLRIVDDILDYSKLEAERLQLEVVGLNLRELIDSVAQLMQGSAAAKGLRLNVVIDPGVRLAVRGDPVRLRQVLVNLVSNAIKFTRQGSVTLQLGKRAESEHHHQVLFGVRDTGIGLDEDSIARLFQPFSQADASTTRLYGGTGLGLVICKRIVELMGGRIGVKSAPGRGSLFWFEVPLLKARGDVRQRRDLEGIRALIVSEEIEFGRRLQHLLAALGISATAAMPAAQALTRLRGNKGSGHWGHELLVIDARSGVQAGTALLHNVLRDPQQDRLRILLSGGKPKVEDAHRLTCLGAGFSAQQLREALHGLFAIDEHAVLSASIEDSTCPLPLAAAESSTPALQGRVLLVEDNAVNRKVADRLLQLIGLEVDHATDGREALELAARTGYQAMLMDCQMPVMDGYAASAAWRQHETLHGLDRLPIIAMTANAMPGDRERCLAAGMDDYLSKPLDRSLLAQTLARWLDPSARSECDPAPPSMDAAREPSTSAMSPLAAPTAQPALDAHIVGELLDVMGGEFTSLVQVFLHTSREQLHALRMAAESGDVPACSGIMHSLKSASANLGALPLAAVAGAAEHAHRGGHAVDWHAVLTQLNLEFERVGSQLQLTLDALGQAQA